MVERNSEPFPKRGIGREDPALTETDVGTNCRVFQISIRIETDKAITKFRQRNFYEHIIRDEKDLQQKRIISLTTPRAGAWITKTPRRRNEGLRSSGNGMILPDHHADRTPAALLPPRIGRLALHRLPAGVHP
mgnify:CR=1 FL=1